MQSCMDCNNKKRDTKLTGSFLCDVCQDKQFTEVRKKVGGNEKVAKLKITVDEFIKMKHEQGMTYVAIARRKGVSDPSIHNWANKNKDEINKKLKRITSQSTREEMLTVSKLEFDQLQEKYSELKEQYGILKEIGIKKVHEKNEDISKLEKELEKYEKEPSPSEELNNWEMKYKMERAAHNQLFRYLSMVTGDDNE